MLIIRDGDNYLLDYTIEDPKERVAFVQQLLAEHDTCLAPFILTEHDTSSTALVLAECDTSSASSILPECNISSASLESMADYILFAMDKQEKKEKKIITDNRAVTINKREISYQGLAEKFENGEDGIHKLIYENPNVIMSPRKSITKQDLKKIPFLSQLHNAIISLEAQVPHSSGRRKYILKKSIIDLRQDQYIIKEAYTRPVSYSNIPHDFYSFVFEENITIDPITVEPTAALHTFSFFNPKHILALLNNYSSLKEDIWDKMNADLHYIMEDLDLLAETALQDYPMFMDILIWKIDGLQNREIKENIYLKYGFDYSVSYLSTIWCHRIPSLIAETAKEQYLVWYYTYQERGKWKRCSCCGEIKLAHNRFFSKNNTSKDGYYSRCKKCRNKIAYENRHHKS